MSPTDNNSGVGQVTGTFVELLAHVGYRFIWGMISLAPQIDVHYDIAFFNASSLGTTYSSFAPSGFGLD